MTPPRQEPLPGRVARMRRLEQHQAYEHSRAVLNAYCLCAENEDDETAFDLSSAGQDDEAIRELVTEAVQYLEWRGLLERSTEDPRWVVVLDESEAEVSA